MKSINHICIFSVIFFLLKTTEILPITPQSSNTIQLYIVVPSYNTEAWIDKTLTSIVTQKYRHWKAIFINDASTDNTGDLADTYIENSSLKNKFFIVHNTKRVGSLANIYMAVSRANPSSVVIVLDGDDWFVNCDVFETIATLYKNDPNLWLTYGSLVTDPPRDTSHMFPPIPTHIIKNRLYRSHIFVYHQLRTYYAGLFQCIKKSDLLYSDGKFLPSAGDVAFMMPMLEMASEGHFRYLPDILYVYNMANPLNDFRNLQLQEECANIARMKAPYQPLKSAPWRKNEINASRIKTLYPFNSFPNS